MKINIRPSAMGDLNQFPNWKVEMISESQEKLINQSSNYYCQPDGWKGVYLDNLVSFDRETLSEKTPQDFSFYYIDISSAFEGKLRLPANKVTFRGSPSRARKVVHQGDILMSTVRPNLKAFAHFDCTNDNYVASTGFAVLTANENVDSRFILYSILSDYVIAQIESHVVGSNYPAINSRDVHRLEILNPPSPNNKKSPKSSPP